MKFELTTLKRNLNGLKFASTDYFKMLTSSFVEIEIRIVTREKFRRVRKHQLYDASSRESVRFQ